MPRWRRRHPVIAGLLVGIAAYAFFAFTLSTFGAADISQALGTPTVIGAATMWFIAWAVFSRSGAQDDDDETRPDAPDA